jgi:hypothetical protein
MTNEQWAYVVDLLGISDAAGRFFGLTSEETAAHRQAFRDAGTIGGDAFLAAVDREIRAAEQRTEPLTAAEQLRLKARRNVAAVLEEWALEDTLEHFHGDQVH